MKRLIIGFLLLLFALWIGYLISQDSGYILISYNGWAIEMSFWVGILLIAVGFFIIYFLARLIKNIFHLGDKLQKWEGTRKHKKTRRLTDIGLCDLAEGNWKEAESNLSKAAKSSRTPLIHYLAAARAAHEQQAFDRRDYYLRLAHKSTKSAEIAVGLTQAELQVNGNQWEQALATLKHLQKLSPKHKHILKLLHDVYLELNDWKNLQQLLADLKRNKVFSETKLNCLTCKVYLHLMQTIELKGESLIQFWDSIPKIAQANPLLINTYSHKLLEQNLDSTAISLIENALRKNWYPELLLHYSEAKGKTLRQLNTAESWLNKHPKDAELFLCLGLLCIREKLWGKAQHYLQASIEIKPTSKAYSALGQVYEALGKQNTALENYRLGLQTI